MRLFFIALAALVFLPAAASDLSRLLVAKGRAALSAENHAAAIDLCEQALAANPAHAGAFVCLARGHGLGGDQEKADKYYRTALSIDPDDRQALSWGGESDLRRGDKDSARAKLRRLGSLCGRCSSYQRLEAAIERHEAEEASAAEKP